jgi:hypothetical protein
VSAEEILANYARFGCHHIACGRQLRHGHHQSAAPWLEQKMRGVAPSLEPARRIVEGARAYASMRGLDDPHSGINYGAIRQSADRVHHLSREYGKLPMFDQTAVPHFDAMRHEVAQQFDHLTNRMGIRAEFVDHDPYRNAGEMARDLQDNKRIKVLSTASTGPHPFFTNEENDKFRAVHDAFGHASTGRDFDGHGEEAAFHAHSRLFSPRALPALASETRGQNGFVIAHDRFGPQKIAVLPRHLWTPDGLDAHESSRASENIEEYRLNRAVQEQRAERASGGYREETRAFYGDPNAARGDGDPEKSLTFHDWLQHTREPRLDDLGPEFHENWRGYELGHTHGLAGGVNVAELEHAHNSSTHPEHFMDGYEEGLGDAMGDDNGRARFAVLKDTSASLDAPVMVRIAHVSGNTIDVLHCPFCGSGSVTARSDGSIECGFCTASFTVQVQPQYAAFPMSVDGQPYPWPGRPGETPPGGPEQPQAAPAGADPGQGAPPFGAGAPGAGEDDEEDPDVDEPDVADSAGDDDAEAGEASVGGRKAPPFVKKKSYRNSRGGRLSEADYLRHLAILHAPDPAAMARHVKASRR